jgi:hypothetical protein
MPFLPQRRDRTANHNALARRGPIAHIPRLALDASIFALGGARRSGTWNTAGFSRQRR